MKVLGKHLPWKLRMTSSGFTLIELMVTIAVLAIIVGIAAPSISNQLANQRVKSTASVIENALKEAKAESIIRRQNITVTYSNTITLTGRNNIVIASYNINSQSIVTQDTTPAAVTQVIFQPNKLISGESTEVVYTICDKGSNNETPMQVRISSVANITVMNAGSC